MNEPFHDQRYPGSPNIPGLDGIRALAILLVILWHFALIGFPPNRLGPFLYLVNCGWMGVDLFFALSGFLITTLLLKREQVSKVSLKAFWFRRALRILPPFYLVLCLNLWLFPRFEVFHPVISMSFLDHLTTCAILAISLFFTNYYAIFFRTDPGSAILVYWSLCVEEHFYFFWPLFMRLLRRLSHRLGFALCLCVVICALRYWAWITRAEIPAGIHMLSHFRIDAILWGAVGALALEWLRREVRLRRLMLAGSALVTLAFIATKQLSGSPTPLGHSLGLSFLGVTASLAIAEIAVSPKNHLAVRILESWALRPIGRVSYEMYLLHFQMIALFKALASWVSIAGTSFPIFLLYYSLSVALSYSAAWIAHELVGQPSLRLKQHYFQ